MFKSIEYKLTLYISLLILTVIGATYTFMSHEYAYVGVLILLAIFSLIQLHKHYRKFNHNILFLLNALDNGDYSFSFSETALSRNEKELNQMLNRIKDILSKARKEIVENETFLSLILESVSTGIIILNEKNDIQKTNHAATQLLGLPILTHLNQLKTVDNRFPDLFRNLQPDENPQIKIMNEREEIQVSLHLSRITMKKGVVKVITLSNIGNELEAKEMESWIRLIRVMTHEIMNSIAPITSLSEIMLYNYKSQDDISSETLLKENTIDALETINTTARGLMSFVESYRRFTGVPKPQLSNMDLQPLVEKIVHLEMQPALEKGVEIEIFSTKDIISVQADENQISQVLVNLIKNAVEAAKPEKEGKICIKISHKDNKTKIDIANNGTPIPKDVLPHIFIPFFTTKDAGTGIGLSISRYIMRLHGGNLKHHTEKGWTVFSMLF